MEFDSKEESPDSKRRKRSVQNDRFGSAETLEEADSPPRDVRDVRDIKGEEKRMFLPEISTRKLI